MAATRADLFAFLDRLGIAHRTIEHPPLPTVEAAMAIWGGMTGGFAKNLFVKDKKRTATFVLTQLTLVGAAVATGLTSTGQIFYTFNNMFVGDLMGDLL